MEQSQQLELVRQFMLAVAPQVTNHHLNLLRHHQLSVAVDEEGLPSLSGVAENAAKLTLEVAMHLAAKYAKLADEAAKPPARQSTERVPPDS